MRYAFVVALQERGIEPSMITSSQIVTISSRAESILYNKGTCWILGIDYVNVPPQDEVKAYRHAISELGI